MEKFMLKGDIVCLYTILHTFHTTTFLIGQIMQFPEGQTTFVELVSCMHSSDVTYRK
jgi:hypothetical protein